MFKKILLILVVSLCAGMGVAHAAVDINKADKAALESIAGIGPAMAERILAERKKGSFKNWADVEVRVKGVKGARAAKLAQAGLTVNGDGRTGEPGEKSAVKKTSAKADDKSSAKSAEKSGANAAHVASNTRKKSEDKERSARKVSDDKESTAGK